VSGPGATPPDPWAVVEYHARNAAQAGSASLTRAERLAMYIAAAPDVVGARPMTAREGGFFQPQDLRWVVASTGDLAELAIDASGGIWVRTPSQMRQVLAAVAAFVIATALFARLAGPRAVVAGGIVAVGVYAVSGALFSRWRRTGTRPGDARYDAQVAEMVARYERPVTPPS
jgi:hypothetical protein